MARRWTGKIIITNWKELKEQILDKCYKERRNTTSYIREIGLIGWWYKNNPISFKTLETLEKLGYKVEFEYIM